MSEAIMLAPSSLDSPAGQQTLTAPEHSQHLLAPRRPPWLTVVWFIRRPSTGIPAWTRWKALSQTVKGTSSTNSSGSGTRRFTAESRHRPRVSGEPVRQVVFLKHVNKSHVWCADGGGGLLFCLSVSCRCNANGPRALLRFHQVRRWAEWAGPLPEASAAPHRHPAAFGPEVGLNTKGGNWCFYLEYPTFHLICLYGRL